MKSILSRLLLITLILTVLPSVASAQTVTKTLVFEIKTAQTITIPNVQTIQNMSNGNDQDSQDGTAADSIAVNAPILQQYLAQKGSPLAPYASDILQNENWKLVLAISNGESTLCKHQIYNNCWGVGGAWNMRHYASFAEGFTDVNRFLTAKYVAKGADTPAEIVNKYVGHPNANWVYAVNKILTEVNNLPLAN